LFSLQSTSKFLCGYYCHLHGWVFRLEVSIVSGSVEMTLLIATITLL
jgi:hypothetical protein